MNLRVMFCVVLYAGVLSSGACEGRKDSPDAATSTIEGTYVLDRADATRVLASAPIATSTEQRELSQKNLEAMATTEMSITLRAGGQAELMFAVTPPGQVTNQQTKAATWKYERDWLSVQLGGSEVLRCDVEGSKLRCRGKLASREAVFAKSPSHS